jgi:phenylacetate-CoA ligase
MSLRKSAFIRALFTAFQTTGSLFYRHRVRRAEEFSPEQANVHHLKLLKRQLGRYVNQIPYYGANIAYIQALSGSTIDDFLSGLPVIDKSVLRDSLRPFFSDGWASGRRIHTTSGSSGSPMQIYSTIRERLYGEAILCSELEKITGQWGLRNCLVLSGFYVNESANRDNFYTWDRINNNVYVSIYHLSKDNADKYAALLERSKPRIVYGYASALNIISSMLAGIGYKASHVDAVISTSEVLYEDWRRSIEGVFGCHVHNLYGSQEGCHFAFECAEGRIHVHPARGLIEVKHDDGTVSREGVGEAVVTAINRSSFPLIRYNLHDVIDLYLPREACLCGMHTYEIRAVSGRSEDMVKTEDGRLIGYLNFHATKDLIGIIESQLIQTGYSSFLMRYVLDAELNPDRSELEASIIASIRGRVGLRVNVVFEAVETIPRDARGKFRAVVVDKF